mgnify:CR=1 FL=1
MTPSSPPPPSLSSELASPFPAVRRETVVPATVGEWRLVAEHLHVEAPSCPALVDVTVAVEQAVAASGVAHGQLVIFCRHTTAAVVVNEDEPLLHHDIADFLERIASSQADYRHDDFTIRTENIVPDHGRNAHAHLKTLVLGTTLVLPVLEGRLALGQWQRVFFLEMDRPKPRVLLLQISGVVPTGQAWA